MRAPLTLLAVVCLAGCGTTSSTTGGTYGNFLSSAPATHEKQLADDAARQLQRLYPPASTRLDLKQPSGDAFGRQLVEALRSQGYALQEVLPPGSAPAASSATAPQEAATHAGASVPFNYVLDAIASPNLYRVTLILGSQSITRAYVPQSDAIHPAGAWVRRE